MIHIAVVEFSDGVKVQCVGRCLAEILNTACALSGHGLWDVWQVTECDE